MNQEVIALITDPLLWVFAVVLVSIVIITALVFAKHVSRFSKKNNLLTDEEIKNSIKVGAIGTIGPAIAVFFVAAGMIAQLGGAITFMRVGIIGSAPLEMMLADIGANVLGTPLGSIDFDGKALTAAVWVMTSVVAGWLVVVGTTTKSMAKTQEKLGSANPKILLYVAGLVPTVLFFVMTADKFKHGTPTIVAILTSALVMLGLELEMKKEKLLFLKEWAMGISMVCAMATGTIAHYILV